MDWGNRFGGTLFDEAGPTTSDSQCTKATSPSGANTKGNYTELIAATAADAYGFLLAVINHTDVNTSLIDIAQGGAGSEQVIVPNFYTQGAGEGWNHAFIPLYIPKGVRLATRSQDSGGGSRQFRVGVWPMYGDFNAMAALSVATQYGVDTSTSTTTAVTASGSINTKGSYAQLTASCNEIRWAVLQLRPNSNNYYLIDIAVGGAGSEQVIVPNLHVRGASGRSFPIGFPLSVPAGSRISARCQCNTASQSVQVALLGVA